MNTRNQTPMSADEIAECKARAKAVFQNFREDYVRHRATSMMGYEDMKEVVCTAIPRLLATLDARDERIRQAEGLLEELSEQCILQEFPSCDEDFAFLNKIAAFLAEGRKG